MEMQGLDELVKALGETSLNLTQKRKLLAKSLRAGGEIVLEEQVPAAPDDPETAGSRVRDNLGISVIDQTATSAEGRIGSRKWGFVARFLERGTSHIRGTHWMGRAFDRIEEKAFERIGEVLGDGIEQSFKRAS